MSRALAAPAPPFDAASMATATKVFAFASMCIGMFIALLDIQIVSACVISAADFRRAPTKPRGCRPVT